MSKATLTNRKSKNKTAEPQYYMKNEFGKISVFDNSQPRTSTGLHFCICVVPYGHWTRNTRTEQDAEQIASNIVDSLIRKHNASS